MHFAISTLQALFFVGVLATTWRVWMLRQTRIRWTSRKGGKVCSFFLSRMRQTLCANSVVLGVGSFLLNFDRFSLCIPMCRRLKYKQNNANIRLANENFNSQKSLQSCKHKQSFKKRIKHIVKPKMLIDWITHILLFAYLSIIQSNASHFSFLTLILLRHNITKRF